MKILKYFFLLLFFSGNAQILTLEECYTLAKQNYPLIKRHDLIEKTKEYTIQNAAKGYSAGRFSLLSWPASIVNAGNVGDISARWLFWV